MPSGRGQLKSMEGAAAGPTGDQAHRVAIPSQTEADPFHCEDLNGRIYMNLFLERLFFDS